MISFGICKSIQKNVEMCRNKSIFYKSCAKETENERLYLHRISIKIEEAKSDKGEAGI